MSAFSLVEIMISMAILTVGLVGSMRVFPVGLQASRRSETSSRAAIAASRTLESLKLQPCGELANGEELVDGLTVTTRVNPSQVEGLVEPGRLKTVNLTVSWTQDGRARSLSFVTYVRCPPS